MATGKSIRRFRASLGCGNVAAQGSAPWRRSRPVLDDQFRKQRAKLVRDLADKADPFIKSRLLDLAARYEGDDRGPAPLRTPQNMQLVSDHNTGSER
jgi:hypothetical protein